MPNWFVSAHASIEHNKASKILNRIKGDSTHFVVPTGIEIVFYCPDDIGLSMTAGWKLWDLLMYGENGGENAAYYAKYKIVRAGTAVSDFYVYIDVNDYNHWVDGPNRGNAHPALNAYGVWRVGDPSVPAIDLASQPNYLTRLSNIVGNALFDGRGVQRIYWGCCKSHFDANGVTSKSARASFTPQGLR